MTTRAVPNSVAGGGGGTAGPSHFVPDLTPAIVVLRARCLELNEMRRVLSLRRMWPEADLYREQAVALERAILVLDGKFTADGEELVDTESQEAPPPGAAGA